MIISTPTVLSPMSLLVVIHLSLCFLDHFTQCFKIQLGILKNAAEYRIFSMHIQPTLCNITTDSHIYVLRTGRYVCRMWQNSGKIDRNIDLMLKECACVSCTLTHVDVQTVLFITVFCCLQMIKQLKCVALCAYQLYLSRKELLALFLTVEWIMLVIQQ